MYKKSLETQNKIDKKTREKNGIVYTPDEIVEFINQSVIDIFKKEFGKDINDDGVNIIDPFTGCGNFMINMLEKMKPEAIERKIKNNEFEAMEITEEAHNEARKNLNNIVKEKTGKDIEFADLKHCDTFQLYEKTEGFTK